MICKDSTIHRKNNDFSGMALFIAIFSFYFDEFWHK